MSGVDDVYSTCTQSIAFLIFKFTGFYFQKLYFALNNGFSCSEHVSLIITEVIRSTRYLEKINIMLET